MPDPTSPVYASTPVLPVDLQGDQDLDALTPEKLKSRYLPGLVLKGPDCKEFDDDFWQWKIDGAKDRFTKYTHIFLKPTRVEAEQHDYIAQDYINWAYIQLYQYPVLDIVEVKAEYPTGSTITVFPSEWIRIRKEHGQLQMVPTSGTLSNILIGRGGSYLGMMRYKVNMLPDLFKVTYDAGLEKGKVPITIVDAVGKLAVIEALTDLSDSIYGPGIQSIAVGIDGLSQNITLNNAQEGGVFATRVNAYLRDLFGRPDIGSRGLLNHLRDIFRGPTIVSA